MKTITLTFLTILLAGQVTAQPLQLRKWFASPTEIDFSGTTPSSNQLWGAPGSNSGLEAYNAWYEEGNMLFYVFNGPNGAEVRNSAHGHLTYLPPSISGSPDLSGRVAIIPHSENFTDLCSKKFWILYHSNSGSSNNVSIILFNYAQSSIGSPSILDISTVSDVPFAVSKMNAQGERYIYVGITSTSGVIKVYKLDNSGVSLAGSLSATYKNGNGEMEINDQGDKLAFVDNVGYIQIHDIDPNTGLPAGTTPTSYIASNAYGLEFNPTSTGIFYSDANGIKYQPFIGFAIAFESNSAFGSGMIERMYHQTGSNPDYICGTSTSLHRIKTSPSIHVDPSWSVNIPGVIMPLQIDGEDVDEKMFTINGPNYPFMKISCAATASYNPVYYKAHPYIAQYFSSQYQVRKLYIGNASGVFPQQNWTVVGTYSVATPTAIPNVISATSSYRIELYDGTNPSCVIFKSYSLYKYCITVAPVLNDFSSWLDNSNTTFARISGVPDAPDEEVVLPGFQSSWVVQKLNDENGMPEWEATEDCWNTEAGMTQEFPGIDEEDHPFVAGGLLDCSISPFGMFAYNTTYRIIRTSVADGMDPIVTERFVETGEPPLPRQGEFDEETGIAEHPEQQFTVYPNPANNILNIVSGLESEHMAELFDMTGKMVLRTVMGAGNHPQQVDVSALTPGIYMLRLISDGKTQSQRVVIH